MTRLICFIASGVLCGFASHAGTPPPEPAPLVSPEVHADGRVTFRYDDDEAESVEVFGDDHLEGTLTKDAKGIWSVTLGPVKPGIYGYSFGVDENEGMTDPSNPWSKPARVVDTSILEVPGDKPLLHEFTDVPHGTLHLHEYKSKATRSLRRLRVYTPPGYDAQGAVRFPVLYLFHGSGDNEATWTDFGRVHLILDNLIAQGKAKPMLLVMTDGHADYTQDEGIHKENFIAFEHDLLDSVLPLVDTSYRTQADANGRSVNGLSLGCFQSLYLGINHPDIFAWVGGMSGYVPDAEAMCAKGLNDPQLNSKLKLLWHSIGRDDFLLEGQKEFEAILEKHHIKRDFHLTEGTHAWPVWRGYLAEFLPLIFR